MPAAPVAAPIAAPAAGGGRLLQVGAFGSRANADALVSRLQASGIGGASVSEASVGGRTVFRVRVGPVADAEQATQLADRLRAFGIPDARPALD
jgi:rare lipoprotein A